MISIRKPNDFHHHLRDDKMLEVTVPNCFNKFKNVIVMPNLIPPVITLYQAFDYRKRILQHDTNNGNPLMTLYLHKKLDINEIKRINNHKEIIGIKFYPKNATTNSKFGIDKLDDIFPILRVMEDENIPLLIHGESILDVDIFKKETIFIKNELTSIIKNFPKLRIVLEHISTKDAVDFVLENNIHATITPHHLLLDRNDIFKNGINPHMYCLPILKKKEDKHALTESVLSGKHNFFLGTDSAPHLEENKLSCCGCAGIFNSPVAVELITQLFDENNCLHNLEKFISTNGCDFYNLPYNEEIIKLEKKEWTVPSKYGNVVPLFNNKIINWQITE
tara:strand:+ start:2400 stop:3401 length:1002 start_codon:yes stop_codon:yes gene_type:complete